MQGRALVLNRRRKYLAHGRVQPQPIGRAQAAAGLGGVNAGEVQDFRGIEVADAGHGVLVQRATLTARRLSPSRSCNVSGRDAKGVGPQSVRAKMRTSAGETSLATPKPRWSQKRICRARPPLSRNTSRRCSSIGRIGQQHQAGHARFQTMMAVGPLSLWERVRVRAGGPGD